MASHTFDTHPHLTPHTTAPRIPRAAAFTTQLGHTLRTWSERARSRQALRALLRLQPMLGGTPVWQDVGRTRAELFAEANKPFWRA